MLSLLLLMNSLEKIAVWLHQWDTYLFLKINTVWTLPFLDGVYPWLREANAWVPLYLFMLLFVILNFKKKAIAWILFVVITLTLTDQISSNLVKNWFARPRPCSDPLLMSQVRLLLDHCSGGYSFTSSHATNHFGFAIFVFITSKPVLKKWGWLFFLWAATISYGQVYVGVHYPLDIVCGALLGSGIGYLTAGFFTKKYGLLTFTTQ